jgi:serine/threonine protein kinase
MHARNQEFLNNSKVTRPRIWTGLLLNESYKVGSLIEQGATTELYDGVEVSTGEPVALKILLPQLAEDAKTRALFLDEARVLTRLWQPGLLRYRACAKDNQFDLTYIVTDVVATRLSSRVHSHSRRPSQQEIIDLTRRLALALGAAHRAGVIHRNLSPHAIALPGGRLADATICDFNLIKAAHTGMNPAFDDAMVDHAYCAPEQLSTSGVESSIGPWTDVYSLALVILAAVSGNTEPGDRKASADLSPLPKKFHPIFAKMLDPVPARRFQSMDEIVKQLDVAGDSPGLDRLLNRVRSISLPRVSSAVAQPSAPARVQPPAAAKSTAAAPAPTRSQPPAPAAAKAPPMAQQAAKTPPVAAPPAKPATSAAPAAKAPEPVVAPAVKVAPVAPAPIKAPPVSASLRTLAPAERLSEKTPAASLGAFHARHSIGLGGIARRAAVALSALLLAASPWILQTAFPEGPADASVVPPGQTETVEAPDAIDAAEAAAASLPAGRVYGGDNTFSRVTLRIHRPARVAVHARGGRLLFSRTVQPGDTYRAPSLPDLRLTTDDAGAVEVLFSGTSAGFAGATGAALDQAPLNRLASLAPPIPRPAVRPQAAPPIEQPNVPTIEFATGDDGSIIASVTAPSQRVETPAEVAPPPVEAAPRATVPEPSIATDVDAAERATASGAPVAEPAPLSMVAAPPPGAPVTAATPPASPAPVIAAPVPPPPPAPVIAEPQLPDPPAFVEVTPRTPRGYVEIPLPPTTAATAQIAVAPPPPAEPERPRYLLDRLFPSRLSPPPAAAAKAPVARPAPPPQAATAKAVPVTAPAAPQPVLSAEAQARAKAAADMAKATRERAQDRVMQENRARERAFFNSAMGVNSRY